MTDSSAGPSRLPDGMVLRVRNPQIPKQVSDIAEIPEDEHIHEVTELPTGSQELSPEAVILEPALQDNVKSEVLDRGYGWVVVFGCFLMHVVNVGLIKSFGILFVQLRVEYGASNYEVSWIYSLFLVCSTWFAPLSTVLSNAFSQRSVVMLGGFFLGLGIALSYFAQSLTFFYISYGCLSGLGSGLAYTPSVVCVGTYFDKRRALANGISLSGAAIGSMTVPYLMLYLLETYSISGAILIGGAIALHVCVAGALLRPIAVHLQILRSQERMRLLKAARLQAGAGNVEADGNLLKAFSAPASARSNGLNSLYGEDTPSSFLETAVNKDERKKSAQSMPDETRLKQKQPATTSGRRNRRPPFWQRFRDRFKRKEGQPPLFDLTLFRVRLFITYALAVMLSTFAYMNIFLILPAHTVDLGYQKSQGAELVAIIGIADIFARIGFGWFSDLKLFHRKWGFCGAVYGASICNFLVIFVSDYTGLAVYSAFLGATSGAYISLVAVICVDFFGIERLSSALGSVIAFQGAAFLSGPPFIGYLKDQTGSYRYGFITLSLCLLTAATLIVVEHLYTVIFDRSTKQREAPRKELELNHEQSEMQLLTSTASQTPATPALPALPEIRTHPPIAHIEEIDLLTPRPVPISKPNLKSKKLFGQR
ncbi:hypothetical protein RvY_09996 [Ramazzottius varieornatus]|uniref:Major facilitator superfamily (MFS) profile domain-containing protein n=1 Tax=Ramazzottius varieornatus TaxID=947166 RepID=A0A1D1VB97_RAMVA|nr:hypothetical protein RvY_09996 [Ramazzottius varieornatus]